MIVEPHRTWPAEWAGKTWRPNGELLTEEHLRAAYEAILRAPKGVDPRPGLLAAFGTPSLSHRRADRGLSLLKRAGLIDYQLFGGSFRWVALS